MTILAAFYKTIVDSPNPNQTQEFDYEASLCSLEKLTPFSSSILITNITISFPINTILSISRFFLRETSVNIINPVILLYTNLLSTLGAPKMIACLY